MPEICNWQNREWMEYFHEHRYLWKPVAEEWARLKEQYLSAKNIKHNEEYTN